MNQLPSRLSAQGIRHNNPVIGITNLSSTHPTTTTTTTTPYNDDSAAGSRTPPIFNEDSVIQSDNLTEYDSLPCQTTAIEHHESCRTYTSPLCCCSPISGRTITAGRNTKSSYASDETRDEDNDRKSISSSLYVERNSQHEMELAHQITVTIQSFLFWIEQQTIALKTYMALLYYNPQLEPPSLTNRIQVLSDSVKDCQVDYEQILAQARKVTDKLKHSSNKMSKDEIERSIERMEQGWHILHTMTNYLGRRLEQGCTTTDRDLGGHGETDMKDMVSSVERRRKSIYRLCGHDDHSFDLVMPRQMELTTSLLDNLRRQEYLLERLNETVEQILNERSPSHDNTSPINRLNTAADPSATTKQTSDHAPKGRVIELNERWHELANSLSQHIASLHTHFFNPATELNPKATATAAPAATFFEKNNSDCNHNINHVITSATNRIIGDDDGDREKNKINNVNNILSITSAATVMTSRPTTPPESHQSDKVINSSRGAKYSGFDMDGSVQFPWKRTTTGSNQLPFYVNVKTTETSWNHPEMIALMTSLSYFNEIRFCAYRTAIKLRAVQKRLCFDLCDLQTVADTIHSELVSSNASINFGSMLTIPRLLTVIRRIYESAAVANPQSAINVPLATDLCLNWLLNLFDENRKGMLKVYALKIALAIMCQADLDEKYEYMFDSVDCASGTLERSITVHSFCQIIECALLFPKLLGEVAAFGGSRAEPSAQCIIQFIGGLHISHNAVSAYRRISINQYRAWLREEPQSLVWLPVMHRLVVSERTKHQVKCNVCKQYPIVGFRYRSLRRFNFDVCQHCFLFARQNNRFKIDDPLHEYYLETTSTDTIRDFIRVLLFKLKKSSVSSNGSHLQCNDHLSSSAEPLRRLGYLPLPRSFNDGRTSSTHSLLDIGLMCDELPVVSKSFELRRMVDERKCGCALDDPEDCVPNSPVGSVERTIEQLENENRVLRDEYAKLTAEHNRNCSFLSKNHRKPHQQPLNRDDSLIQHYKQKLENRMRIVEQHNLRLELQLRQLKQHVSNTTCASSDKSQPFSIRMRSASNAMNASETKVAEMNFEDESVSLPSSLHTKWSFQSQEDGHRQIKSSSSQRDYRQFPLANLFICADDINKAVGQLIAQTVIDRDRENSTENEERYENENNREHCCSNT